MLRILLMRLGFHKPSASGGDVKTLVELIPLLGGIVGSIPRSFATDFSPVWETFFDASSALLRGSSLPVVILLFFSSCKNDIDTINLITAGKDVPTQTSNDIVLTYSDSAVLKARLTSPRIEHYQGDSLFDLFPKGVHLEFFDDSMHVQSQMTSKYAIRFEQLGRMEAKNDVVVFNKKGEKLNTEHLIWDEQKQIIYTNAFVKITTLEEIIYGDGFESNQDFSKYKIKNIKGTISLKEEQEKNK